LISPGWIARAGVLLYPDKSGIYEVEIGSLPTGIDIRFLKNNDYQYSPTALETVVDIIIANQTGSSRGDFNIPIIYSKKDTPDSSMICQINIINL